MARENINNKEEGGKEIISAQTPNDNFPYSHTGKSNNITFLFTCEFSFGFCHALFYSNSHLIQSVPGLPRFLQFSVHRFLE